MTTYCEECIDTLSESMASDDTDKELLQVKVNSHKHLVKFYEDFSEMNTSVEYYYCKSCSNKFKQTSGISFEKNNYTFEEMSEKISSKNSTLLVHKLGQYLYVDNQLASIKETVDFTKSDKVSLYRLIGTNPISSLNGQSNLGVLQKQGYNMSFDSPPMQNVHFSLENLIEHEEFNENIASSLYIIEFSVPLNEIEVAIQTGYLYPTIEVLTEHKVPPANITVMPTLDGKNNVNLADFDMNKSRDNNQTFYREFIEAKNEVFKKRGTDKVINDIKSAIHF